MAGVELLDILTALGSVGTLVGALFVWATLKADHDWQRRQYAVDILRDWDKNTAGPVSFIEKAFPGIRDKDQIVGKKNEITLERARDIFYSRPVGDPENFALRNEFFHLLNYLKYIVAACNAEVADEAIIMETLHRPMELWVTSLANFMAETERASGRHSWKSLTDAIDVWNAQPLNKRPARATFHSWLLRIKKRRG